MSNPVDWTYSVKDISGSTSIGVATVEALTNRYRVVSAAKQFSLFMLIALIFLPIPLMHFVFVPLFIVVAFVRAA
ncbi:MAG: hypothetical protein V4692_13295, partial [Bdellovibrionota bacterium]